MTVKKTAGAKSEDSQKCNGPFRQNFSNTASSFSCERQPKISLDQKTLIWQKKTTPAIWQVFDEKLVLAKKKED